jgi:hypothetical protein
MRDLPPELAEYTKFLLEEGTVERPTLQAPPTIEDVTLEAATDELDDPAAIVRRSEVDLKADLAIRMALDTKGYPLSDLALLISQITAVPVQIDWVSFDLAGVDVTTPLAAPTGWRTARETLEAVASGLGAEVRDEEGMVVITLTDAAFSERLTQLMDLSDFGDQQESAKQILIEFLRGEGEEPGEELTLGVTREDQQIAAIAAEGLRRMRGIAPKVDDGTLRRWGWCSNDATAGWPLLEGGQSLSQPDAPITVADWIRQTARRNQAAAIINWDDFGRRRVSPAHLMIPHAEVDAGASLQWALQPLGLQVRQVDSKHWWAGRESTYDRLPVIVWTPPLGEQRDRFSADLSAVMQDATRDVFRMTVDPSSDRALMLLPRFVVRQLAKLADGIAAK